jgi:hypothetical protein
MAALRRYLPRSPTELLSHILEHKELVGAIRELPPAMLSRLVDRIGLEDSGDLIALASTEQLAALLDHDVWRADESGFEERFDPRRFALWLQVMGEAGEEFLVRRLSELPVDLLTLAVNRLVLVIDMDALRGFYAGARDEAGQIESALESAVSEEWEEFCLIARDIDAWEDVWNALLSLDKDHHTRLRAILEQCCAMSLEYIDGQGGLYDVLTSDEMLESDALAGRDDRRASQGYVSRSDAWAFLELARDTQQPLTGRDAITTGYFRDLDTMVRSDAAASLVGRGALARTGVGAQELMRLVAEIDMDVKPGPSSARLLPPAPAMGRPPAAERPSSVRRRPAKDDPAAVLGTGEKPSAGAPRKRGREHSAPPELRPSRAGRRPATMREARESLATPTGAREGRPLAEALAALANTDPMLHTARTQELAYLANVLLSACTHEGRNLRPVEALEAALATSNLGYELWQQVEPEQTVESNVQLLRAVECDRMFRLAWAALQQGVVQVAASTLNARCAKLDARRLQKVQKALKERTAHEMRRVCAAHELGLDEESFELLLAAAQRLPSQLRDAERNTSPWIGTRTELERLQTQVNELALTDSTRSET